MFAEQVPISLLLAIQTVRLLGALNMSFAYVADQLRHIEINSPLAKLGAASETPTSVDYRGSNLSDSQIDTHTPTTGHSGPVGGSSGYERDDAVSEGLHSSNAKLLTSHSSVRLGATDNDASTTTNRRGEMPGSSHVTAPGSALEPTDNSTAYPTHSAKHNAATSGAGLTTNEMTHDDGAQHISESYDSTERAFPLGGANTPLSNARSQTGAFQEYRETVGNPTSSSTSNAGPNSQPGGRSAQNLNNFREDVTNDTELGTYGPESWQHEHNKHGHEFIPVQQHETLMGTLLDPHSSSSAKDVTTEPRSNLNEETAISGVALAGAGAAWERSQNHSALSSGIPSSAVHADVAHGRSGLDTEPTSATAHSPAVGDTSKHYEHNYGRSVNQVGTSNSALDSAGIELSGPVYKSSILNKLDPRVKETSPSAVNKASTSQPMGSTSLSSASPYNSLQLDPRVNSGSRNDTTSIQGHTGRDAAAAGASGGTAVAAADYAKERDHQKLSTGHEASAPVQNRGFMGVGDSGFDHDRAELDPQRTRFAPPSAVTQALSRPSESRAEPVPTTKQSYATEHRSRRDAATAGSGVAATAEGVRAHHDLAESNPSTQPTRQSYNEASSQEPQHHYTRDAASVGTEAGAAEGIRHHQNQAESTRKTQPIDLAPGREAERDHHYTRDAADGRTGALAAKEIHRKEETSQAEFSKQDAERTSKQDAEHAKALEKEKEKKAKALEKEQRKEEKAIAAEYKKEDRALAHQQKEEAKHEKIVAREQQEHEKEAKQLEKQHKQEEKALAKKEKAHAKHGEELAATAAIAEKEHVDNNEEPADHMHSKKDDRRHEKLHAALEKAQTREEKQFEKAQKEHEKENANAHSEKKHKGILGLFHREKKPDKEAEVEDLENRGHSSFGLTGAKPAEAGVVTPSAYEMTEHEKQHHEKHERNRLHKVSSPDSFSTAQATTSAPLQGPTHLKGYADMHRSLVYLANLSFNEAGLITCPGVGVTMSNNLSGIRTCRCYCRSRFVVSKLTIIKDPPTSLLPTAGNTAYAEPPKSGYAAQVTGGTGTTALAQGDDFSRGSHISAIGNKLDPA